MKNEQLIQLIKENAGLKAHLAKEKRKNRVLRKFVLQELYFIINGAQAQINQLQWRKKTNSDPLECEKLTIAMRCTVNKMSEINKILDDYEKAIRCI